MSSALPTTSLTWDLEAVKTEGESLRAEHRMKSGPAEKASPADIFKQRAEDENALPQTALYDIFISRKEEVRLTLEDKVRLYCEAIRTQDTDLFRTLWSDQSPCTLISIGTVFTGYDAIVRDFLIGGGATASYFYGPLQPGA